MTVTGPPKTRKLRKNEKKKLHQPCTVRSRPNALAQPPPVGQPCFTPGTEEGQDHSDDSGELHIKWEKTACTCDNCQIEGHGHRKKRDGLSAAARRMAEAEKKKSGKKENKRLAPIVYCTISKAVDCADPSCHYHCLGCVHQPPGIEAEVPYENSLVFCSDIEQDFDFSAFSDSKYPENDDDVKSSGESGEASPAADSANQELPGEDSDLEAVSMALESTRQHKKLVVKRFFDLLCVAPKMSIFTAIRSFEQVPCDMTFQQFVTKRQRTQRSYVEVYQPLFRKARAKYVKFRDSTPPNSGAVVIAPIGNNPILNSSAVPPTGETKNTSDDCLTLDAFIKTTPTIQRYIFTRLPASRDKVGIVKRVMAYFLGLKTVSVTNHTTPHAGDEIFSIDDVEKRTFRHLARFFDYETNVNLRPNYEVIKLCGYKGVKLVDIYADLLTYLQSHDELFKFSVLQADGKLRSGDISRGKVVSIASKFGNYQSLLDESSIILGNTIDYMLFTMINRDLKQVLMRPNAPTSVQPLFGLPSVQATFPNRGK